MKKTEAAQPAIIVIFGVTGDLVQRKLFPALSDLIKANLLHEKTTIVGITRQDITANQLLDKLLKGNPSLDQKAIDLLRDRFVVQNMDVTEGSDYDQLLT